MWGTGTGAGAAVVGRGARPSGGGVGRVGTPGKDAEGVGTGAGGIGAVARWTGVVVGGVGAGRGLLSAGAVVRGAPRGERRRPVGREAGAGAGSAGVAGWGDAGEAGAGRAPAGWEVGAPRPARGAAVLRWTGGTARGVPGRGVELGWGGRTASVLVLVLVLVPVSVPRSVPAECRVVAVSVPGRAMGREAPSVAPGSDGRAGAGVAPGVAVRSVERCTGGAADGPVGGCGAVVRGVAVRRWTGGVVAAASRERFAGGGAEDGRGPVMPWTFCGEVGAVVGVVVPGRPLSAGSAGGRPVVTGVDGSGAGVPRGTARRTGGRGLPGAALPAP
ncbi:hypothetical protein FM21_28255 [Streptomyces mutabilis]|uniref:Uncharacterized protein n=1 Tax=Streptomyces mutabilis TaxID=67332 RepID=A0A086N0F4_9ACTN|nr:hypothetical protein FM21_28255 [Streptomyces mutabilis]